MPRKAHLCLFSLPLFKVNFGNLIAALYLTKHYFQSFFPSRSRPPPKNILTAWLDQGQETTTKLALATTTHHIPQYTLPIISSTEMTPKPSPRIPLTTLPSIPTTTSLSYYYHHHSTTTFPSTSTKEVSITTPPPTPSPLLAHSIHDQEHPGRVGDFSETEMTQLVTLG